MGIFTFIGVVLILAPLILLIASIQIRRKLKEDENSNYKGIGQKFLLWFSPKKSLIVAGVGLLLIFNTSFLFYASPGHQYFIVSPAGTKSAIFSSGIKFITPLSKVQEWQKFFDIKVISGMNLLRELRG